MQVEFFQWPKIATERPLHCIATAPIPKRWRTRDHVLSHHWTVSRFLLDGTRVSNCESLPAHSAMTSSGHSSLARYEPLSSPNHPPHFFRQLADCAIMRKSQGPSAARRGRRGMNMPNGNAGHTVGLPYRLADHRRNWALWFFAFCFDGCVIPVGLFYALWFGSSLSHWSGMEVVLRPPEIKGLKTDAPAQCSRLPPLSHSGHPITNVRYALLFSPPN